MSSWKQPGQQWEVGCGAGQCAASGICDAAVAFGAHVLEQQQHLGLGRFKRCACGGSCTALLCVATGVLLSASSRARCVVASSSRCFIWRSLVQYRPTKLTRAHLTVLVWRCYS